MALTARMAAQLLLTILLLLSPPPPRRRPLSLVSGDIAIVAYCKMIENKSLQGKSCSSWRFAHIIFFSYTLLSKPKQKGAAADGRGPV